MKRLALLILAVPLAAIAAETVAPPDLPPADTWVRTDGGQIRVLDKQKAQSTLLTLKDGQTVTFESLALTMLACVIRPPELAPNAAGFLQITDQRAGEPGFRGWMLSGQPGLATLQSPVYGVRVVGCDKPTAEQLAAAMPPRAPPPSPPPAAAPAVTAPAPDKDLNPPPGQDLGSPGGQ